MCRTSIAVVGDAKVSKRCGGDASSRRGAGEWTGSGESEKSRIVHLRKRGSRGRYEINSFN